MKKLLLLLLCVPLIGLGQINYCDSANLTIAVGTTSTPANATLNPGINSNFSNNVSYLEWSVSNINSGLLPSSSFIPSTTFQNPVVGLNQSDTFEVCLTIILDTSNQVFTCIQCDTFLFDGLGWVQFSFGNWTTSIEEQVENKKLLKVTDILGRETPHKKNTTLFYIFDDGTVEKKIIID